MKTVINNITPDFFAVYFREDGSTFKKIQDSIDVEDLHQYDDVTKAELYENGTENLAPQMIDRVQR